MDNSQRPNRSTAPRISKRRQHVLITGGAGFVGSHIARSLLDEGWAVDIVDDLSTGALSNVDDGADFYNLDVSQPRSIDKLPQRPYQAIFHLAGQSSGEKSFDNPGYDLDANAKSTILLANWALRRGIPSILHASSMGVYGQPDVNAVPEDTRLAPISWYGASKRAAEKALAVAALNGLNACSLRMFSIYGPGQDLTEMRQGMVSIYLAYLLQNKPITVKGSLSRKRDFVFVEDCVMAWKLAFERQLSGVYNLGTGVGTTVRELLDELVRLTGRPSDYPVHSVEPTPGDQFSVYADPAKLSRDLGWKPEIGLTRGLTEMIAWATSE